MVRNSVAEILEKHVTFERFACEQGVDLVTFTRGLHDSRHRGFWNGGKP